MNRRSFRLTSLAGAIAAPLVIRSITSTTWGHEAWEVRPVLRRALAMRRQIAREGR